MALGHLRSMPPCCRRWFLLSDQQEPAARPATGGVRPVSDAGGGETLHVITRPTGIEVALSSTYEAAELNELARPGAATQRRGGTPFSQAGAADTTGVLIEALQAQELVLPDDIPLPASAGSAPTAAGRRGGGRDANWRQPVSASPSPPRTTRSCCSNGTGCMLGSFRTRWRRHSAAASRPTPARPTRIRYHAGRPRQPAAPRRSISGFMGDHLFGRIRAVVFRFLARVAVDQAMAFLERHVQLGLVEMRGEPHEWAALRPPAAPRVPTSLGRLRVLIFLHGTFSTTRGSFGALGLTDDGKEVPPPSMTSWSASTIRP